MMLKKMLKKSIPETFHPTARRAWTRALNFGFSRYCPVCENHVRSFLPHGIPIRSDALCPICGSKEPHRLAWLYFSRRTTLLHEKQSILHIAPEREIEKKLRKLSNLHYVSADINPGPRSLKVDVTRMPFEDSRFDVIYCCHVLNMVSDDCAAIREISRTLKPSGWALLQVPTSGAQTVEAAGTEVERLRLFNDAAMYRIYGPDVVQRFEREGLSVQVFRASEVAEGKELERFSVAGEQLFICRRGETA